MVEGLPSWHPPQAVLELTELVLGGALPEYPVPVRPPAELLAAATAAGGLVLEDAEGTPVAVLVDGRPRPARPFMHGPLRSRRRTAAELRAEDAGPSGERLPGERPFGAPVPGERVPGEPAREERVPGEPAREERARAGTGTGERRLLAVPVTGPLTRDAVTEVVGRAVEARCELLWLVVVGAGRSGPLPPESLLRAVQGAAADAAGRGAPGTVLPVAVPRLAEPGDDVLLDAVGRGYGAMETLVPDPPDLPDTGAAPAAMPDGSAEVPDTGAVPDGSATTDVAGDGAGAGGEAGSDGRLWHPASARELERRHRPPARRGVTVFLTGLSGSGKSTIARGLAERLLDDGRRSVSLLDGDEVRRLLSHGLGFSRADRDLNIRRIGFVAAEITRHGGVAVCAPIAPFARVRREVRERVEEAGDFLLVHVSTPLAECERRDRKGLYARARQGLVPDFTGISSPYEVPDDAQLRIDTTDLSENAAVDLVWDLLVERGYLPAG